MVGAVNQAIKLRVDGVGQVCIGEVGDRAPPGFDFGNSPFEVSEIDFAEKMIIQRTSAGTQGVVAARHAQRLYAASLVTASATARALLSRSGDRISLVAMGSEGVVRTDEDESRAIYLRNRLEGRFGNATAVREELLAGGDVLRFHDPSRPHLNRR